jgi:hypothetical protein
MEENPVQSSFTESRNSENIKYFLTIDPFMSFTYAEIIHKFVAYKGFQQVVDVNPVLLVFTKN